MSFRLRFLLLPALATFVAGAEITSQPLLPRSGPRGRTLFQSLSSDRTGIAGRNNYDDPRMWAERSRGFFYGPLGTGVAIGDYDADGRPDILIVSKVEGHQLFRNLGDWRFENVTQRTGVTTPSDGEWEQGAAWVDVNNDGRLDLYICRSGAANLLYMNQGDGTFREEGAARGLGIRDDSVMASFCDYDRDGWLDMYLVTNTLDVAHEDGRPDLLFHNNGDGTFTDVTAAAGIGSYPFQGHAALWWDYDNDGWPDLYVANDFSPPDIIYHNERNGKFSLDRNSAVPHTTNSSMGGDTGDLNNDGWIDLFVADMAPTTHEKEYRTIAEARAKMNDPFLDPFDPVQLPRNALFLNTGTPFSLEAAELTGLARTDWTWSVRCEDFDCDGRVDLHFTNGMNREQTNVDLTRRLAAAESVREQIQLMKSSPVLAEANLAFRNLGDLQFQEVGADWGLDHFGVSFGAALGDLDGDGDLDLVFTNYQAGATILRNDADEGHRILFDLRGQASNKFGVGAILRIETPGGSQVRELALARGYMSTSEPVLHFGLGKSDHVERATITWPSGHRQELGRLAADRRYVVTEDATTATLAPPEPLPQSQFREVSRFAGLVAITEEAKFDEYPVQPLAPRTFNLAGPAVAVGDVDGNGRDDVCVGGTTETPPRLFVADGHGNFQESPALSEFRNPRVNQGPVLIFDADGDDRVDVLVTAGGVAETADHAAYQPELLLNRGGLAFIRAPMEALPAFRQPVGAAVAADYDRDGRLDVFLGGRVRRGAYPVAPPSMLLHNKGGIFSDVTDAVAPALRLVGNVTSALFSDVDQDGWLDLLVATEWGTVRYFRNHGGRSFEDQTAAAGFDRGGSGLWSSLAAADFNGDGRLDYAAGNLGLNTPYKASARQPLELIRGKFAGSDEELVVEGYWEGERLVPRSSRGELGKALPSVLARYPGANAYSRATLPEILGAAALTSATRTKVNQLASGVYLSQPDGTFGFQAWPRIAQIAPAQGMVAGDFDGDGHADLLLGQNACTYSQTLGRFDSGLGQYLRGNGRGDFDPVPPATSGLLVPGDCRAVALVNFDDDAWPDFFVSRNRGPTLAWQNRGASGNKTLRIRLRGNAGNRSCIGTRVQVFLSDGSSQTSEVAAGGGVLSQSSPELTFGCPAGRLPARVKLQWPSGEVSEADLPSATGLIQISQPPS